MLLFFTVPLIFSQSGDTVVLTLEDAVKTAVENNISIKQSEITLEAKKRSSDYSWNSISPSVSASGNYSLAVPGSSDDKASLSAGVSLSTSLSPSVYTSVKGAELDYDQQKLTYDNDVRTVELNVRKSYYSILYEMEQIALQEKSLETTRNQYETNLAKYNRGTLSRLDVLSAQVEYQNGQLELKSLKTTLENDLAAFKQTIGIPQETEISLSGSFEDILNLKEISTDGLEFRSYDIESLEKQLKNAENSLLASRFSAYGPSLTASYSYAYSSSDGGSSWNDGGTLSLGASIPLDGFLPWSERALNVETQKDSIKDLELQLSDARTTLAVNVSTLLKEINQCLENLELRKSSIDLAQATYEMTLEAYNHGTRDLLSLQTASDDLLTSRVNLISEAYNLICSVLDLENTIGVPFGTLEK